MNNEPLRPKRQYTMGRVELTPEGVSRVIPLSRLRAETLLHQRAVRELTDAARAYSHEQTDETLAKLLHAALGFPRYG